jgi:hypothetical protein
MEWHLFHGQKILEIEKLNYLVANDRKNFNLESVNFSSDEWKQMEMLCDLLSPFQQVTESLCAE